MTMQLICSPRFKREKFYDQYKNERRGPIKIRLLAMHHLQQGHTLPEVCTFIGETDQTITEWLKWYENGGLSHLQARSFTRGRRKKLSPEQEAALAEEIAKLQSIRPSRKVTGNELRLHIESLWGIHFAIGSVYSVLKRLNLLLYAKKEGENG